MLAFMSPISETDVNLGKQNLNQITLKTIIMKFELEIIEIASYQILHPM